MFCIKIALPFPMLKTGRAKCNRHHGYFFQWTKYFPDVFGVKSGLIQKRDHFSQFIAAIVIDVTVIMGKIKMTVGKRYHQYPLRFGHPCDFLQGFFIILEMLQNLGRYYMRKIFIIKGQIHGIGNHILPPSMDLLQHVKSGRRQVRIDNIFPCGQHGGNPAADLQNNSFLFGTHGFFNGTFS
ncbi:MAG: hypothetical protein BWX99_02046 [Deltaproteobacteria bacterium ADurb.Bin151]|nr:MAG: hypothetical protein BWX99_02046 [Deltaproteobacteria bacterium ADurb.Bin151]